MVTKMSKSNPMGCINVNDSAMEIQLKIAQAYCPDTAADNALVDILAYCVFPKLLIKIKGKEYSTKNELSKDFDEKVINYMELKLACSYGVLKVLNKEDANDFFEYYEKGIMVK